MVATILRPERVIQLRGKSRSGHYADVAAGLFTKPVKIGARASGWPEHEVAALQAAQIAEMPTEEIRALVTRLQAARRQDL